MNVVVPLLVAVSLCVLNMASNRLSVKVNVVFLFAKLLALVIIIVGGIVALATGRFFVSSLSLSLSSFSSLLPFWQRLLRVSDIGVDRTLVNT